MTSRRTFLALSVASGASALGLGSAAKSEAAQYSVLSEPQAAVLGALGELLVPGAASAGIARYVDRQLTQSSMDQVLIVRYLGLPQPILRFYLDGLDALNRLALARHALSYPQLRAADATGLIEELSRGGSLEWKGPPAQLFYFALRNDAVDVVYGTQVGFATLGVPYMAHIPPPSKWPN